MLLTDSVHRGFGTVKKPIGFMINLQSSEDEPNRTRNGSYDNAVSEGRCRAGHVQIHLRTFCLVIRR